MTRQKIQAQSIAVVLILLGAAAFELVRIIKGDHWPNFYRSTNSLDALFLPFWLLASVGILLRTTWGWIIGFASALFMVVYGMGIDILGGYQGLFFILAGIVVLSLLISGKLWNAAQEKQRKTRQKVHPIRPHRRAA